MKYNNIVKAEFISRENRFIAYCLVDGKVEKCHVKNTGRCKELLIQGVDVYLEYNDNPNRKTKYSLIAVLKRDRLINMDSQIPNFVVYEAIQNGEILKEMTNSIYVLKKEVTFNKSRFDIYLETNDKKIFIEVKGVTLEENGVVMFPDAPTQRGVKHIYELCDAVKQGYEAYILFLVQMEDVEYFTPNAKTHKEFQEALSYAKINGVKILCYDCKVKQDEIILNKPIIVVI